MERNGKKKWFFLFVFCPNDVIFFMKGKKREGREGVGEVLS